MFQLFEKIWSWRLLTISSFHCFFLGSPPWIQVWLYLTTDAVALLFILVSLVSSTVDGLCWDPINICGMKEKNRKKTSFLYREGSLEIPIKTSTFRLKCHCRKQITQKLHWETFGIRRLCIFVGLQHHLFENEDEDPRICQELQSFLLPIIPHTYNLVHTAPFSPSQFSLILGGGIRDVI